MPACFQSAVSSVMWCRALPFLCCCWQSESDGRPPSGLSCSCKSFQQDPSDAVKANGNKLSTSSYYLSCTSAYSWTVLTSRMKNLAVLALPQVFFSRDTGLMFIPATGGNGFQLLIPGHAGEFSVVILSDITKLDSQMMAIRELKFPMLKHSLATSMKNSITWALCFFFAGCKRHTRDSCVTHLSNFSQ